METDFQSVRMVVMLFFFGLISPWPDTGERCLPAWLVPILIFQFLSV